MYANTAEVVTKDEVAIRLGCSTRHVDHLIEDGIVPPPLASLKRGRNGRVLWLRATIDRWFASGCPAHKERDRQAVGA